MTVVPVPRRSDSASVSAPSARITVRVTNPETAAIAIATIKKLF
jgi:hypothetical protein